MADKVIEVPIRVRDLAGLLFDLQKADYSVRNVGASAEKTYVYLDPSEDKDPAPMVVEWSTRAVPTAKEMMARAIRWKSELETVRAKKEEAAKAALIAEAEAAAAAAAAEAGALTEDPEPEEPSLIRRIFRKLW